MSMPPPPPGSDQPRPGFGAPPPPPGYSPPQPHPGAQAPSPAYGAPTYGVPSPVYPTYGQAADGGAYAGFGARLVATIVDSIVFALISAPFTIGGVLSLRKALDDCVTIDYGDRTELVCGDQGVDGKFIALAVALFIAGAIVSAIMYARWIGRLGQTPGMRSMNIKVVDAGSGAPIGAGRATGRYFARILSGAVCGLGYLWMLWDPRKQTWHDKIVGSVVVKA